MGKIRSCLECGSLFTADACPTCNETKIVPAALRTGEIFHGLEILDEIGRGGVGIVYRARGAGRVVALKVLRPDKALDPQFGGRFGRETKALAALDHPNIVRILDYGFEHDLYFFTMEFVEGMPLRKRIEWGPFPQSQLRAIFAQLLDALDYAHGRGVVHRDIKPENLMIEPSGRLKVLDFGLAKMAGAAYEGLTDTFTRLGTDHYSAPEQMLNPRGVDHRADLYAAAVVLHEMLTGRHPDPPVFQDPKLQSFFLRGLARDPNDRFANVAELRRAFELLWG